MKMSRFLTILLLTVSIGLFVTAAFFIGFSLAMSSPTVRAYNILVNDEKMSLKGTEIKSNGMCIEVWKDGRIDTIVCGHTLITEVN